MSKFNAPQKPLRSSWVQIAYTRSKKGQVVKRSLGSRATPIIKDGGTVFSPSSKIHSNLY